MWLARTKLLDSKRHSIASNPILLVGIRLPVLIRIHLLLLVLRFRASQESKFDESHLKSSQH